MDGLICFPLNYSIEKTQLEIIWVVSVCKEITKNFTTTYLQVSHLINGQAFLKFHFKYFRLCLVLENFEGKYKVKKIKRKRKKKVLKNVKKIDLKLINYFYMLFQTHFTYFSHFM